MRAAPLGNLKLSQLAGQRVTEVVVVLVAALISSTVLANGLRRRRDAAAKPGHQGAAWITVGGILTFLTAVTAIGALALEVSYPTRHLTPPDTLLGQPRPPGVEQAARPQLLSVFTGDDEEDDTVLVYGTRAHPLVVGVQVKRYLVTPNPTRELRRIRTGYPVTAIDPGDLGGTAACTVIRLDEAVPHASLCLFHDRGSSLFVLDSSPGDDAAGRARLIRSSVLSRS